MKKILLFCTVALTLAAPAFAGLDLAWTNCATNGGVGNFTLDCVSGAPSGLLHGTFSSPATSSTVIAFDGDMDLETESATLPDFYFYRTPLEPANCNPGVTFTDAYPATCAGAADLCTDIDPGDGCDTSFGYDAQVSGDPNRGRFIFSVFRTATTTVSASTQYFLFRMSFNDTNVGTCAGCSTPAAIVWNTLTLVGSAAADVTPEAIVIGGPGILSNCATLQNAGAGTCAATPTKNKTWGALKSLYR